MGLRRSRNVRFTRHVITLAFLLAVLFVVGIACQQSVKPQVNAVRFEPEPHVHAYTAPSTVQSDAFEERAIADPLGTLRGLLAESRESLSDYTCTFIKRDRLNGKLGRPEEIRIKCRERPFSVLMEWVRNPTCCDRVLYVKGRWINRNGGEEAWVDPQGVLVNLVLGARGGIRYDIAKGVAEGRTRRPISEFGFVNMLRLIVSISELAATRGELVLNYLGQSQLDDRGTYVFERVLPYAGLQGPYPDRVLIVHLDRESHLPIGLFAYADDDREVLLGSYVMRDVTLNPGLSNAVFSKEANGF